MNGCTSDDYEELSGGYIYRDESEEIHEILSHDPKFQQIYSTIVAYNYDHDFIVALQKPNLKYHISSIGFDLRDDLTKYPKNSIADMNESERVADSIIKRDPYYQKIFSGKLNYWIISNAERHVYGPLTKDEYLQERIKLKVPANLRLKAVSMNISPESL